MYFVEKTNDEYIHEESRCGYCGSYRVTFVTKEFRGDELVWGYRCNDCERRGKKVYYLVCEYEFGYNAHLEESDDNGNAEG